MGQQAVAFGSAGQVYVVWSATQNPGDAAHGYSVLLSVSTNGGATFAPAAVVSAGSGNPGPDFATPELVVDPRTASLTDDRIFVATRNLRLDRAMVIRSDTSGASWQPAVEASDTAAAPPSWSGDVVTTPGNAYVRAIELTQPVLGDAPTGGGPRALYLGWVSPKNTGACPNICESTGETNSHGYLVVAKSTDLGLTWTRTRVVNVRGPLLPTSRTRAGENAPRLAAGRGRDLFMVYNQLRGVSPSTNCGQGPFPDSGTQCPVYTGFAGPDSSANWDRDIYSIRSVDGGTSWGSLRRLNEPKRPGLVVAEVNQTFRPQVAVAPDGRIDVIWSDRRHWYLNTSARKVATIGAALASAYPCVTVGANCSEARLTDTYYSRSRDRGQSFAVSRRVNDRSTNADVGASADRLALYPDHGPVLAYVSDDRLLVADVDTRMGNAGNGRQDVFLRQVDLEAARPVPTLSLGTGNSPALSVTLSRRAYPGGGEAVPGIGPSSRAWTRPVIVNEADFPAALAGGVLARSMLGPVLAAPAAGLPAPVAAEVDRLDPVGAFIVGDATKLSAQTEAQLVAAGVPAGQIVRISGATPAELAANMALVMDRRRPEDKSPNPPLPAFDAVVIANPNSASASSAAALAANRRLPMLYVDQNAVPAVTTDTINALNVTHKIIVGSTGVVSQGVQTSLGAGTTRLSGPDQFGVSRSVLIESVSRGLPTNVVYVADGNEPMHGALLGPAVARLGGLLALSQGGAPASVAATLDSIGICQVDKIVTTDLFGTAVVANDPGNVPGTVEPPTTPPAPCPAPATEPPPEVPDTAAPHTAIAAGPANGSWLLATSAVFRYRSSEPGSTFTCTLDAVAKACGASSVALTGLSRRTHVFGVAATDPSSNRDPTPATRTFTVPRDNTELGHSAGWRKRTGSGYYLGSYSETSQKGRALTISVTAARSLALVATRGPGFGTVKVSIGSTVLKTIKLQAAKVAKKRVIPIAAFGAARSGKVKIVVVSSGGTVRVEGLGVATK